MSVVCMDAGLSCGTGVGMIGRDDDISVSEPFAESVANRILPVLLRHGSDAWSAGDAAQPGRFL
jgi:hypothetical protein